MASSHYKRVLLAALVIGSGTGLSAQVSYSQIGSTYTQNFDSATVLAAGSTAWTNNETYAGWYASAYNATTSVYTAPVAATVTNGSGTGFNFYRTTGSTDIALGAQVTDSEETGGDQSGGFYYGVGITNGTSLTLSSFTFGYTGEEWRRAGNTVAHTLVFSYSLNATSLTDTTATWATVTAARFLTPQTASTALSLDGNAAANRAVISGIAISSIAVETGSTIWLRWYDVNNTNSDHGMGIDDFNFTATSSAVPEPSTYAALVGAAGLLLAGLSRRKKAERRR